jgi:NADH:ubiquinone oxidoreductase subunit 6 (subunit J)
MIDPGTIGQGVTDWQGSNVSFWFVTIIVVMSAFVAALSRSIVQAAFALFFTLLGMAGYYVLLGSGFLAITQVIIYVGGILVLLMFGVLLTNRPLQREQKGTTLLYAIGGSLGALFLLIVLVRIISTIPWQQATTIAAPPSDVRPIGMMLLTNYLLPFELAGMTLLLCLIGAAYLVRRRER